MESKILSSTEILKDLKKKKKAIQVTELASLWDSMCLS